MPTIKIIRKSEVLEILTISHATLYRRIKDGLIPSAISLGGNSVGYLLHEIDQVVKAMIAGKSESQIKSLVSSLVKQRETLLEAL